MGDISPVKFLLHSLPPGFQRIRYYGFPANYHRAGKLDLCRKCLATRCSKLVPCPTDSREFYALLTGRNLSRCPKCRVGTT